VDMHRLLGKIRAHLPAEDEANGVA
jgi:hypothetical protein